MMMMMNTFSVLDVSYLTFDVKHLSSVNIGSADMLVSHSLTHLTHF